VNAMTWKPTNNMRAKMRREHGTESERRLAVARNLCAYTAKRKHLTAPREPPPAEPTNPAKPKGAH
jgi:hypothetical protein